MLSAFASRKRLVGSLDWLDRLIGRAPDCPIAQDVLRRHVARGLANYAVTPISGEQQSAWLSFRHHDLFTYALDPDVPVTALTCLAEMHRASLSNVVPHLPVDELVGIADDQTSPLALDSLLESTEVLAGWLPGVEGIYREAPLLADRWSTVVALGLDVARIAVVHELSRRTNTGVAPLFRRQRVLDEASLLATLFNAMAGLVYDGVIRRNQPSHERWVMLLDYPEAALRCSSDGPFVVMPGPDILRDIAMRSGQPVPPKMYMSANPDILAAYLLRGELESAWSVLSMSGPDVQAFIVQSPIDPTHHSVFVVHLKSPLAFHAGDLTRGTQNFWSEALVSMISGATERVVRMAEAV